jgi:hypothetical protein
MADSKRIMADSKRIMRGNRLKMAKLCQNEKSTSTILSKKNDKE